jgi:hypothetical protein
MPLATLCDRSPRLPLAAWRLRAAPPCSDQPVVAMKTPQQMRPGNRYARETGASPTLGELVRAKMALVAVCRRCKHRRLLYPANLIPQFGEEFPAIELRQRMRCSSCRATVANLHESSR